ncbi:MAG: hypothetical protein C0600_07515, partial [Ignavibacteria bacterium]
MNRRIATVAFLTICFLFSPMTAQPQQSAAYQPDAGPGGHEISAAPILVLVQNVSALDAEEQKVTAFLSTQGFSYDVTDASGLSSFNADDYSLIIFRTGSTPASYNNATVLSEIQDAVEIAGATLMVELHGSYLAEYLGWGTVSSVGWGPVVAASCAFVAPITTHVIFDGIATWDPPIPPDQNDQIIWENPNINGGSGVRIDAIANEVAIESWHVQMTPGWTGQPTNSTYCQSWGGCTNERSVHNAWDQTQNTKYVVKGNGKLFFSAPIGFGGAFATDAAVVIGKAGTTLKRNTVQWLSQVLTPPDPPSNLTASAVSPTKVQLSWTDNSNSESRFVIEKQWTSTTWIRIDTVLANTTSCVVVNLQPDTEHSFRVFAANWKFESDPTNVASVTTPTFPAPSDLAVDSVAVTSIVMHWRDNSVNEDRFVIEQSEDGIQWAQVATTGKDTTRKRVEGLVPQKKYHFRVYAVEGTVPSGSSNVLTATTLTFPPPLNLQATGHSSEEVALQWQDQTDFEEGFMIEYREENGAWLLADTVPANSSAYILGGLQPSTTYEVRMRAFTSQATSPYSNTAQATTLLFLQNPANLSGVLMSETNIVLTWDDNSDGESGFEVEHQEDNGSWITLTTTAANVTTYAAQGLTPRTMNRFRVRAVGNQAASGYSNTVAIETRMAPAKPQNLLATAVDHKTVRVTWQRGSENEEGYKVEKKAEGGSWALFTTAGPGDGDILDENLPSATLYWYRARAVNDLGESAWSNE